MYVGDDEQEEYHSGKDRARGPRWFITGIYGNRVGMVPSYTRQFFFKTLL